MTLIVCDSCLRNPPTLVVEYTERARFEVCHDCVVSLPVVPDGTVITRLVTEANAGVNAE